jgi:CRISPR-associated protein Cas6
VSGDIVDVVFPLSGESVALDYADLLLQALLARLPWLADEAAAGVHPLGAVSPGDHVLYLAKRAKLALRLPAERVDATRVLTGERLDLGGEVAVGAASVRPLTPFRTLYSSFVTVGEADEYAFLDACGAQLKAMAIVAETICGKPRHGAGSHGQWHGFSLMLHGLNEDQSLRLQREGLGFERKRGCGIFIPHKSIAAVS